MKDYTARESSSGQEDKTGTMLKVGILGLVLSSQLISEKPIEGSPSSSSCSRLKSYFVGMGFSPTLVEQVIEDKGEEDMDLLLETLFTYSDLRKSNSVSSGIEYPRKDVDSSPAVFTTHAGQEIEVISNETSFQSKDKRLPLLEMGFSEDEISSAIARSGAEVPILELADSIFANQIADRCIHEERIHEDAIVEMKMEMLNAAVISLL